MMAQPRPDRHEFEEFISALKEIIFSEREVESAKIELALKSDFNIIDTFRMMDVRNANYLTQADLNEGLQQNLRFSEFTPDDLYLLFRRFDKTNTGQLTFNDFSRAVLPFSREYASLITDRTDYYSRRTQDASRYFNETTRYEMQAFFGVLLRKERSMEALRLRLSARPYMNFREMFEAFNRSSAGVILVNDMRDVLAEQGFYSTERELQGLLFRLDRD